MGMKDIIRFLFSLVEMAKLLATVLQIVLLAQITRYNKACFVKAPKSPSAKELKLPGPWNDDTFKRYFSSCECGQKVSPGQIPTWAVYIHAGSHICSGTIVTSNLVATSHECVRLPNKTLNGYDAWNISADYKAFEKVNYIKVTSSEDATAGETFPVLQLIPNPQFLLSWKTKSIKLGYGSLDLLLIKVKADFTCHKQYSPICILEDSNDLDFVEQTAYYNTNHEDSALGNISETHEGVIFTQKMCESAGVDRDIYLSEPGGREKHDELSGLCFRWIKPAGFQPPIGGTLFLKSASGHSFLAGVASNYNITTIKEASESWVDYSPFSNIIPMIKYLEYRAHQHRSIWCEAPTFKDKRPLVNGRRWLWPWETKSVQETFKGRNETLDCVCGVPDQPSSQIVGVAETTTKEFGWMAVVGKYLDGNFAGAYTCGGTVINDRMILTAAHCMVLKANFKTGQSIKPEELTVYIQIHDKIRAYWKGVERVIVHPNFAVAAAKNSLDYDIALLILKDKLDLTGADWLWPDPKLSSVCLPKMGEVINPVGENATVAGWGLTIPDTNGIGFNILQKLDVPIHPLENCKGFAPFPITDRFLCAGTHKDFINEGKGDSGGPLSIIRGEKWTEVGIVSWGKSTGSGSNHENATLYTSIANRNILHFIDYFAERTGVQWCKSGS